MKKCIIIFLTIFIASFFTLQIFANAPNTSSSNSALEVKKDEKASGAKSTDIEKKSDEKSLNSAEVGTSQNLETAKVQNDEKQKEHKQNSNKKHHKLNFALGFTYEADTTYATGLPLTIDYKFEDRFWFFNIDVGAVLGIWQFNPNTGFSYLKYYFSYHIDINLKPLDYFQFELGYVHTANGNIPAAENLFYLLGKIKIPFGKPKVGAVIFHGGLAIRGSILEKDFLFSPVAFDVNTMEYTYIYDFGISFGPYGLEDGVNYTGSLMLSNMYGKDIFNINYLMIRIDNKIHAGKFGDFNIDFGYGIPAFYSGAAGPNRFFINIGYSIGF